MEEALRLSIDFIPCLLILGFNPCFNGRGVKTNVKTAESLEISVFQSLF